MHADVGEIDMAAGDPLRGAGTFVTGTGGQLRGYRW